MSVSGVTTTSDITTCTASSIGGTTLGKDDFLTILVAQLENQDPLDPQDSTEFISQMAQFTSLEQQIQTNENLETLIESVGNTESYAAFHLLGTEIVVNSDTFSYTGEEVELGFSLEEGATDLEITVLDADGQAVATLDVAQADAGNTFVTWDGTADNGAQLASGEYSFTVSSDEDSEYLDATPLVRSMVRQIALESSGSLLLTDAGEFSLSDVASVSEG